MGDGAVNSGKGPDREDDTSLPWSSLPHWMRERPRTPSCSWSPGCGKAQTLGSFGEEAVFRPHNPLLASAGSFSSCFSRLLFSKPVSFMCVRTCLHPVSLCLIPMQLSFSVCLCLSRSLLCSDYLCACGFLSGFLFSFVL